MLSYFRFLNNLLAYATYYTLYIHPLSLSSFPFSHPLFPHPASTRVFHNLTLNLPILCNISSNLLWQRNLLALIVLPLQQDQINTRCFAREELCLVALLAEVDSCPVYLVHEDGREGAFDLESEVGAFDDVDG